MLSEDKIYEYLDEQEDQEKMFEFLSILQKEIFDQEPHWEILQNFLYKQLNNGSKPHASSAFKILKMLQKSNNPLIHEYNLKLIKNNVESLGSQDVTFLSSPP